MEKLLKYLAAQERLDYRFKVVESIRQKSLAEDAVGRAYGRKENKRSTSLAKLLTDEANVLAVATVLKQVRQYGSRGGNAYTGFLQAANASRSAAGRKSLDPDALVRSKMWTQVCQVVEASMKERGELSPFLLPLLDEIEFARHLFDGRGLALSATLREDLGLDGVSLDTVESGPGVARARESIAAWARSASLADVTALLDDSASEPLWRDVFRNATCAGDDEAGPVFAAGGASPMGTWLLALLDNPDLSQRVLEDATFGVLSREAGSNGGGTSLLPRFFHSARAAGRVFSSEFAGKIGDLFASSQGKQHVLVDAVCHSPECLGCPRVFKAVMSQGWSSNDWWAALSNIQGERWQAAIHSVCGGVLPEHMDDYLLNALQNTTTWHLEGVTKDVLVPLLALSDPRARSEALRIAGIIHGRSASPQVAEAKVARSISR